MGRCAKHITVAPEAITALPEVQQRAEGIDDVRVGEYIERMGAGDTFPPVLCYYQPGEIDTLYLADGFHRLMASTKAGKQIEITREPAEDPQRQALLYACGANCEHGQPRSQADKRKAIMTLLRDREWSKWADRTIARHCKVDHKTVAKYRNELAAGTHAGNSPDSQTPVTAADVVELEVHTRHVTIEPRELEVQTRRVTLNPVYEPASIEGEHQPAPKPQPTVTRKVERGGKTYEMKTAGINASRAPAKPPKPAATTEAAVQKFKDQCAAMVNTSGSLTKRDAYLAGSHAVSVVLAMLPRMSERESMAVVAKIQQGLVIDPDAPACSAEDYKNAARGH